jgi:hypothetical protein
VRLIKLKAIEWLQTTQLQTSLSSKDNIHLLLNGAIVYMPRKQLGLVVKGLKSSDFDQKRIIGGQASSQRYE